MTVTVQIPCRIRMDPEGARGADDLVAAFRSAVGRAVERATREVVAPRGGLPALAPEGPAFRWTGAAVDRVPAAGRRALERRLRAVVEDAVAAAGTIAGTGGESRPAPAAGRVAEPHEAARERPILRTYRVPFYDGGEGEVVFADDPITVRPPKGHEWKAARSWTPAEVAELAREAVRQFGLLPREVPGGLIAKTRGKDGSTWFSILILSKPVSVFNVPSFGRYEFQPATKTFTEHLGDTPPAVPGTVERRSATSRAQLIGVVDELMGEDIRIQLEQAVPINPETETRDEYNAVVDRAIDDEVARRVDAVLARLKGTAPTGVVIVRLGSFYAIYVTTAEDDKTLYWTGTANILPVAVEVPLGGGAGPGPGAGGGTEGRGRRGAGTGGGASGDGPPGTGGDGTGGEGGGGDGTGTGAGRPQRGGFVFDPTAPTAPSWAEGSRFPVVRRGGEGMTCESFQGEPPVSALGADGEPLKRLVDDIAYRLQIQPCYFTARFCLMAAAALRTRAYDISVYIGVSEREAFTQPVPEGNGELGVLRIHPVASPAIQFLRHLAGVVPRLHNLALAVMATYEKPAHWARIDSDWTSPPSWNLHFLEDFTPAVKEAVAEIFVSGTQAMLMQLLLASRRGIEARISQFPRYAPIFERLMVSQLTDYAELQRLRDRLRRHEAARWTQNATAAAGGDVTAAVAATNPATAWFSAARALSGAFLAAEEAMTTTGTAGEIVEGAAGNSGPETAAGVARIRDSHGVLWTVAELEQAMVLQRGQAEGIDPLVKQISNIPDVLDRFKRDPSAIREVLAQVLEEMRANNAEMLAKTKADAWFAFRSSRIADNIPAATVPGSRYALQGIHLQTHQQLGEFFGGNTFYALGIDYLFGSEQGMQALKNIALMVGIVVLCVLCPPLGFVTGVVVAAVDVVKAHEKARLYGALIDPELVLTRAEVEVELFAAYLGLALSLIPEAGTVIGALGRGAKVGLRAGLTAGVRSAGRYVVRRAVRQMIEAAAKDLVKEFVTQMVMAVVLQKVIEKALEPVLSYLEREAMIRDAVGGPEGAAFVLMVLGREHAGSRP